MIIYIYYIFIWTNNDILETYNSFTMIFFFSLKMVWEPGVEGNYLLHNIPKLLLKMQEGLHH